MTHYLVLGAGMQGTAAVYDLITNCGASQITWIEKDEATLCQALGKIYCLTSFEPLQALTMDLSKITSPLRKCFEKADLCFSALPYYLAPKMTKLALDSNTHYVDLGGNTGISIEQLNLAAEHTNGKQLNILPDCGLMPGMGNLFAAYALQELGECESIKIRCGGIPLRPEPPLDYMLVFSIEGLINEYFGEAHVLRDHEVLTIDTFSELEGLEFKGLPPLEAFTTSGGIGTCPWTFQGQVKNLDYKTIRYKGHYDKFKVLSDLGFLETDKILVGDQSVVPREVLQALLTKTLAPSPDAKDIAILRCTAVSSDLKRGLEMSIFEHHDNVTGFTAMERTTAFAATACADAIMQGETRTGAYPLEVAVNPFGFVNALKKRGIKVLFRKFTP